MDSVLGFMEVDFDVLTAGFFSDCLRVTLLGKHGPFLDGIPRR